MIDIAIYPSEEEILSGIPRYVTITTDIVCNVFYTLDGTTPTEDSDIYVGTLEMPRNMTSITLSAYASNGVDESLVITQIFSPNHSHLRYPFKKVISAPNEINNIYPFGTPEINLPIQYSGIAGSIVDSPDIENVLDGYDADGNPIGNSDYAASEYDLLFSETNSKGERGRGIGTLPSTVTVNFPANVQEYSETTNRLFNPKALVIYQDGTKNQGDPDLININRPFFSLAEPAKYKDGSLLYNESADSPLTGKFVRSVFNHKDQTITYYYHDSASLRWIISKEPYSPAAGAHDLSQVVFSPRQEGVGFVFQWRPFMGRRLI